MKWQDFNFFFFAADASSASAANIVYNITLKLAKSTSTIYRFINNLQPNHKQILDKSTIYKKGNPPPYLVSRTDQSCIRYFSSPCKSTMFKLST